MAPPDPDPSQILLVDVRDGVGLVTLNRPAVRNALSPELRRLLFSAMRDLDADVAVHAIVLTGSDPAFCAGLDLKHLAEQGLGAPPAMEPAMEEVPSSPETIGHHLPFGAVTKPLIGAINGVAVTGGLELALGCDFLLASERAGFADTHARVGVMPGWGLTVLLPQTIGRRRAHQMSFTGNYVDAATALEWGLVNEVVPHSELLPRAMSVATDMASVPIEHLVAIKRAYQVANGPTDGPALAAELAFSEEWARDFDPTAFAARRSSIEARGREQQ